MGKKKRVYRSESSMHEVLEEWAVSGLSRAAYCRQRGLSLSVFNYWAKRDLQNGGVFREIKVPEGAFTGSTGSYVRLLYPDGRVVEFEGGDRLSDLRTVLSW
jgi:hypothetical protein